MNPFFGASPRAQAALPAGPAAWGQLPEGVAALLDLGVSLDLDPQLQEPPPEDRTWLAGPDLWRAERLVAAIDAAPDLIWIIRGGFGSTRLLGAGAGDIITAQRRAIDFRGRPVPLVAFSDGTALLAFWDQQGWPAWSGPPLTQLTRLEPLSIARLRAAIGAGIIAPFEELRGLHAGVAEGRTIIVNLCVLTSLIGTPLIPDLAGAILVIEDTGEPPYKLDRLMTQLVKSGAIDGIAGFVFADFVADRRLPESSLDDLQRVFQHFVNDWAASRGIPVASAMPIGHGSENTLLPFGAATGLIGRLEVEGAGAVLAWQRRG